MLTYNLDIAVGYCSINGTFMHEFMHGSMHGFMQESMQESMHGFMHGAVYKSGGQYRRKNRQSLFSGRAKIVGVCFRGVQESASKSSSCGAQASFQSLARKNQSQNRVCVADCRF